MLGHDSGVAPADVARWSKDARALPTLVANEAGRQRRRHLLNGGFIVAVGHWTPVPVACSIHGRALGAKNAMATPKIDGRRNVVVAVSALQTFHLSYLFHMLFFFRTPSNF